MLPEVTVCKTRETGISGRVPTLRLQRDLLVCLVFSDLSVISPKERGPSSVTVASFRFPGHDSSTTATMVTSV